jgi:[ribosomal protein S5]-alanine N-acetyltransferase
MTDVLGESDRLVLRRLRLEDEAEYLDMRRRSEAFLAPWSPAPPVNADPYSSQSFVEVYKSDDGLNRVCGLLVAQDDGRLVGVINANSIVRGVFQNAFLGYWLAAGETGQGYMGEGLALMLDFVLRAESAGGLGLHRVEANIMPHNAASKAVVQRLGFRLEGLSPGYLKIAGSWQTHERWALLAEEWSGSWAR